MGRITADEAAKVADGKYATDKYLKLLKERAEVIGEYREILGRGEGTFLEKVPLPSPNPTPLSPKTFAFIESLFAALLRRGLPLR